MSLTCIKWCGGIKVTRHLWIYDNKGRAASSAQKGSSSHKNIDLSANPILRHYYHNKVILFTMCAANELFFCMLYLNYFTGGPAILGIGLWKLLCILCAPLAAIKMFISILQLGAAMENYAIMDREDRARAAANQKKLG
ncbi:CDP-diacylglycerol--inositol 3-phosphatidyltransferase [Elysia marginata]|uniref:CDP-diacylglycerol--inositol 3-phosphatidyltransferase n=1 Tax=Elysia marginata TaxID=1093978 RepID=A0AAV4HP65_9GAST|nr:CDP-diacylglycerol--inositol 3-phosphatidyltransferase [Elysia marginata]